MRIFAERKLGYGRCSTPSALGRSPAKHHHEVQRSIFQEDDIFAILAEGDI